MRFSFRHKNLAAILLLGVSSGLPFALLAGTLTARYTQAGLSIMTIGALSLVQLPYLLKPLWAPLLDRFNPFIFQRRRSWIFLMQLVMAIILVAMALVPAQLHPVGLAYIALALGFASASFDIAYDAYRTDLLPAADRGSGAAMVSIGYRAAGFISGALALVLAEFFGFRLTYLTMAAIMASLMLLTAVCPDPAMDTPAVANTYEMWLAPLRNLLRRSNILLILFFIVVYKLCDAFALSLSTTFLLRGLGFSLATVGAAMKTVSLVATLLGAVIGGYAMRRISLWQSLFYFGILQALSNGGYLLLAIVGKSFTLMLAAVFVEYFCGGLVTVALVAYLTSLCARQFSATQYALLSALASVGRVAIGPVAAMIELHYGWVGYFSASILLGLPPLVLLLLWRQRVIGEVDELAVSMAAN